jgi:hypothetical protein
MISWVQTPNHDSVDRNLDVTLKLWPNQESAGVPTEAIKARQTSSVMPLAWPRSIASVNTFPMHPA